MNPVAPRESAVYSATQSRPHPAIPASSAQTSHVESRAHVLSEYSGGVASLHALAQVQGFLSSNPADCAGLQQYLGSISAASSVSGDDAGIAYASGVTAIVAPAQGDSGDNLTVVAPFSGHVAGELNLRVSLNTRA